MAVQVRYNRALEDQILRCLEKVIELYCSIFRFEIVLTVRNKLNPKLVAQHCSVARLGRCFEFFTLRDQLDAQRKHLSRVEERQHADWLTCLSMGKSVA